MSETNSHINFTLTDLEAIFRSNYKSLCLMAYRVTNCKDTAEDIVQDCFYKLWKSKDAIMVKTSLKAYLYRSVTNAALNHIRLAKKHSDITELSLEPFEENVVSEPQVDITKKVKEAIETLPPKCKTIFILSRYQGMKYREIAETLNISIKTVENQMSIAFEKLRENLKEYASIIPLFILLF